MVYYVIQKLKTKMKQLILLILVFFLVPNLANDFRGRPGRVKFDLTNSSVETLISPSQS
jgi:hypothetical protein